MAKIHAAKTRNYRLTALTILVPFWHSWEFGLGTGRLLERGRPHRQPPSRQPRDAHAIGDKFVSMGERVRAHLPAISRGLIQITLGISLSLVTSACDAEDGIKTVTESYPLRVTLDLRIDGQHVRIERVVECNIHLSVRVKDGKVESTSGRTSWNAEIIDHEFPDGSGLRLYGPSSGCPAYPPRVRDVPWLKTDNTPNYEDKTLLPIVIWTDSLEMPSVVEVSDRIFQGPQFDSRVVPTSIHYEEVEGGASFDTILRDPRFDRLENYRNPVSDLAGTRLLTRLSAGVYTEDSWRSIKPLAEVLSSLESPTILDPAVHAELAPLYEVEPGDESGIWRRPGKLRLLLQYTPDRRWVSFHWDSRAWDLRTFTTNRRYYDLGDPRGPEDPLISPSSPDYTYSLSEFPFTKVRLGQLEVDLKDHLSVIQARFGGLWMYDPQARLLYRLHDKPPPAQMIN